MPGLLVGNGRDRHRKLLPAKTDGQVKPQLQAIVSSVAWLIAAETTEGSLKHESREQRTVMMLFEELQREGKLIYEASIPWTKLGTPKPPKPGERIGIALTVSDMDNPQQRDPSEVGLFAGIVPPKDPDKFGLLILASDLLRPTVDGTP